MLAKRRSEQLFMVPWRARGTVAFEADRNVGTLVCPASPRPTVRCALRRPDPPVVCPGFGLDRYPMSIYSNDDSAFESKMEELFDGERINRITT